MIFFLPIPSFSFNYGKLNEKLHTFFTELMLKRNYLATNSMSVTFAHTRKEIDKYIKKCDEVFQIISNDIKNKKINLKSKVRVLIYQKI